MNILTFDVEDWFCHDNYTQDFNWHKYEVRINKGMDLSEGSAWTAFPIKH